MKLNIVFLGTPWFAAECLNGLLQKGINIKGVLTQPDRPIGRGLNLEPTAVKKVARKAGIKILQPEKASSVESIEVLSLFKPDLILVVAYGEILKKPFLDLAGAGCVNLHASLLPEYRGAAPVQWAIINGEARTGLTTFFLDEGMDSGDIIVQKQIEIKKDESAGELLERMISPSIDILVETIRLIQKGNPPRLAQDDKIATYAPKIKKEDGFLDWNNSAVHIYNLLRGLHPWPGISTRLTWKEKQLELKIIKAEVDETITGSPGEILKISNDLMWVSAANGSVVLKQVQVAGKKVQEAGRFVSGYQLKVGDRFVTDPSLWT